MKKSDENLESKTGRVRLHKYIADCGVASRRKAEELIETGRVEVNGKTVTKLGITILPDVDRVYVQKKLVRPSEKGLFIFHKPRHVVSTMADPEGRPCIADYLTKRYRSYFPVGRLDWDSSGLVVLTNDGELADRLLHPRFESSRLYEVKVEGSVPEVVLEKMRRGVPLIDGRAKADARVIKEAEQYTWLEISLNEGRNRIIRRMMEKLGYPVEKLKRTRHGPFQLGRLPPGSLRKLTEKEYIQARKKVFQEYLESSRAGTDAGSKTSAISAADKKSTVSKGLSGSKRKNPVRKPRSRSRSD